MRENCSGGRPAMPLWNCSTSTASVLPASRSASISPTQTMGFRPAASDATVFCRTVSPVSPKNWRRSLWPMMTHPAPTAAIMGAETSPVNAPSFFQYTSWAPIPTLLPLVAATAAAMFTNVGAITTSQCAAPATRGQNFSKKAVVSLADLYIFQLPAITGFLIRLGLKSSLLFQFELESSRPPSAPYRPGWPVCRGSHRAAPLRRTPAAAHIHGCGRWTAWWDRTRDLQ